MGDRFDPDNIIAYNFQPRWSDSASAATEESGAAAGVREAVAPLADPNLLDAQSVAEWDGVDSETEGWRLDQFTWCRCRNCQQMTTVLECVCCHDLTEAENLGVNGDINCLLSHPTLNNVIINEDALRFALIARWDLVRERAREPYENRTYRLQAYRQVTNWLHGRLGKRVRRVIPSCVVWAVREAYPEDSGQYTGFLEGDEFVTDYQYY
ncbi:P2RX7 [Branchiostoma lanceolatum]|uniref:P2RX7 protein n=1 Tax=Branchiostoma lanceolatum TaxID=7740 RepID=A0A8K0EED8_BRALA|nr:P2RX7 [Branchiostoma lanceolatum]